MLVGAVDLDGDGKAELVVLERHRAMGEFVIFREAQGRWRELYRGGRYEC